MTTSNSIKVNALLRVIYLWGEGGGGCQLAVSFIALPIRW